MSQIDINQIKLIVENNMRNAGLSGQFENGWKDSIQVSQNQSVNVQFNLKTLRDIISQSILDILTNSQATGTISNGNNSGTQVIINDNSIINITKNNSLPSSPAARLNDTTLIDTISDPVFTTWIENISTAVNILAPGSVPVIPVSASGKISSGSTSVQIGE